MNWIRPFLYLFCFCSMAAAHSQAESLLLASRTDGGLKKILHSQTKETQIEPQAKQIVVQKTATNKIQEFLKEIRFEIQESLEFPEGLKGKGLYAVVVVEFELKADGKLKSIKAFVRTGEVLQAFEEGAIQAVQRACEFFPPVPYDIETVKIKIPIVFEDV